MTPSHSDESLVARLLALPVAERAAALERACAEDPALRERVPAIMAALNASQFLPEAGPGGGHSAQAIMLALNAALDVSPTEVPGGEDWTL